MGPVQGVLVADHDVVVRDYGVLIVERRAVNGRQHVLKVVRELVMID